MVVKTDALKDNPDFGKALTGAWYEIMTLMSRHGGKARRRSRRWPRPRAPISPAYKAQLTTTKMFYDAGDGAASPSGPEPRRRWTWCAASPSTTAFSAEGAKSKDVVGIAFPDGETLGDKDNVKLRFDAEYMKLAPTASSEWSRRLDQPAAGGRAPGSRCAALLVLVARLSALLGERLADNPNDKLLPGLSAIARRDPPHGVRAGPAERQVPALGRHLGEPDPAGLGLGCRRAAGAGHRRDDRPHPLRPRRLAPSRCGGLA